MYNMPDVSNMSAAAIVNKQAHDCGSHVLLWDVLVLDATRQIKPALNETWLQQLYVINPIAPPRNHITHFGLGAWVSELRSLR